VRCLIERGGDIESRMMLEQQEKQRIVAAQNGDVEAFESLVDHYAEDMYNLALRIVDHPEEAEDLVQEAFVRAWRGLSTFRGDARFSTWLYRIVVNLCYNRLPRLKRELAALAPDDAALHMPDTVSDAPAQLISAELVAVIHQEIHNLPSNYRLLITLRHLQEMSYNEIADVTELPLGTVKTGIFRARRLLRDALESYIDVKSDADTSQAANPARAGTA
jgi:RNA polymerase sigma-70 factor, ECF subfamily